MRPSSTSTAIPLSTRKPSSPRTKPMRGISLSCGFGGGVLECLHPLHRRRRIRLRRRNGHQHPKAALPRAVCAGRAYLVEVSGDWDGADTVEASDRGHESEENLGDPISEAVRKRYALLALAFLLLLLGGVGMYYGAHNFRIRAMGVVAVMAGARVVVMSREAVRPGLPVPTGPKIDLSSGPGRWLWIVSVALVPLLGAAILLMYIDAANGGHEAWPADVFAAVALVCAIVWSFLAVFGHRARPR